MSLHLESRRNSTWARSRARMPAQALLRLLPLLVLVALVGAPGAVGAQVGSYGYFTVTPDPRLCPAPTCGGFHLQALNQSLATCADGSQQVSCYVASADFGALQAPPSFAPGEVVVRGRIAADDYPGFGNLGKLVAESAWTGATSQAAQGTIFRIRDLGIVCVTAPCFSIEARVLNQTTILAVSTLDHRSGSWPCRRGPCAARVPVLAARTRQAPLPLRRGVLGRRELQRRRSLPATSRVRARRPLPDRLQRLLRGRRLYEQCRLRCHPVLRERRPLSHRRCLPPGGRLQPARQRLPAHRMCGSRNLRSDRRAGGRLRMGVLAPNVRGPAGL
jgi:hypothetical protein